MQNSDSDLLRQLYTEVPETLDRLPYTESFDWIFNEYVGKGGEKTSKPEVWHALTSLRKRSELPRKRKAK